MKKEKIAGLVFLILLLAVSLSFANAAPPMRPLTYLNITKNSQPYPGNLNVTYVCVQPSKADKDGISFRVGLLCVKGECNNALAYDYMGKNWFDYGEPCFYSKGKFVVETEGKNITSEEVSLERGGLYFFSFDIETGELTASENNPPPGPAPDSSVCCPSTLLIATILFGAFIRRK